jgi:bile acid-coenzyme A ligase
VPLVSFAQRLTDLAVSDPHRPAITCGSTTLSRRDLESRANRLARVLSTRGVVASDMVTIALTNSTSWFVAVCAAWKLGAIPQPVSAHMPEPELRAVIELGNPRVVIGVERDVLDGRSEISGDFESMSEVDDSPLSDAVSPSWKAPTSGGSTGQPKIIVSGDPATFDPDVPSPLHISGHGCTLVPGPLYHNGPILWACMALMYGDHVVVLPKFDAAATLAAIDRHHVEVVYLVPTMMKRIVRLPEIERVGYNLSSLRAVWHVAEPCPIWLKAAWIDWLGPDRIFEVYGGTEGQVATVITGTEWLDHRGSVGRPVGGALMICDADGNGLPAGEVGEVWMRSERPTPAYRYVGATARSRDGGWESLGDIGWLDDEGYLYLKDRMEDMVISGGANIYPAEVEGVIQEHKAIRSCAVIGLPDDDLGNRVHAIVEAEPNSVSEAELLAFIGQRLVRYKVPRSIEIVSEPLRDDAGKVRRSALRAARLRNHVATP